MKKCLRNTEISIDEGSDLVRERAIDDLDRIHRFIARDSLKYASLTTQRIKRAVESAARMPEAGSIVPDFNSPEVPEVLAGKYRIIYQLLETEIFIVTIHHGARPIRIRRPFSDR